MIGIVYHNFLTGNWKTIVTEQLKRLKDSGLYDSCDIMWATVNLNQHKEDEYKEHVKEYDKIQFDFQVNNGAEYPGIKKVKELGNTYDDIKIFYFHTKGVSNDWTEWENKERNEEKVRNVSAWRECLEYFLIDRWKESLEKLDEYDNVGVTCNGGWYWGNFWWSQSKHIKKCREVDYWSRWAYEAWLNDYVSGQKNFEWYKFTYNPYLGEIVTDWYKNPEKFKNSKIILHKALYGTSRFAIDEGYGNIPLGQLVDVTDKVNELLSRNNYEKFDLYLNHISLGIEDPVPGFRKVAYIDFSLDIDPNRIYNIGVHEGGSIELNFN
jgi:hypothetical protein